MKIITGFLDGITKNSYPSLFGLILAFSAIGCSSNSGRIKSGDALVVGFKDAGKSATLETANSGEVLPIPAGSTITVTKTEPVAAIPDASETPAVAAQPAKEVTEIKLTAPTEWRKTGQFVKADTGTVDTSIAAKRIDAEESRFLLYLACVAVIAAGVFQFWLHYPSPAMCCAAAAVVFFAAWKASGLPPWFWGLGIAGIAIAVGIYFGHERAEKTAALTPPPK